MSALASSRPLRINQITGTTISAAMHVHSLLGPRLLKSVYQGCLLHELRKRGLRWRDKLACPLCTTERKLSSDTEFTCWSKIWWYRGQIPGRNSSRPSSPASHLPPAQRHRRWLADQFQRAPPPRRNQTHGSRQRLGTIVCPSVILGALCLKAVVSFPRQGEKL
jgi:hypothetical protein